MQAEAKAALFESMRPNLLGLAYRILGIFADAEDAVQDTYLTWSTADSKDIANPNAWLTTVCTRRCIDLLRAAHRTRVDYVGAWLPEPIHIPVEQTPLTPVDLASSLSTAFLLMLERLTPKERAAYLLREIFDMDYPDVASTLNISESNCRKLVSRAKSAVEKNHFRQSTSLAQQEQLVNAFQTAITLGDTAPLALLLSDEVQLSADGGGKVPAPLQALQGKAAVMAFLSEKLSSYWANFRWRFADINGGRGILLEENGVVIATVTFAYQQDKTTHIFIVRNPDKLHSFAPVSTVNAVKKIV